MATKPYPATYDELIALPDDCIGEIVDGNLFASPRPRARHAHVAVSLIQFLAPADYRRRPRDGWWFLVEPELHLGDDVLVPDLAAWEIAHAPLDGGAVGISVRPDWVCEILSPATRTLDFRRKLPAYALHRVPHLWLVDPERKFLEAFALASHAWQSLGRWDAESTVIAPPFEEIPIALANLWLS
ncbi:MAG TPA: Uma2 family endonuclease [Thermoanaerobaculia bacterium]|nr:Uma2 family endonuclease [Thermoanaerobaculia bacterium]